MQSLSTPSFSVAPCTCIQLGQAKVVRSALRFCRKYWAAHLLNAKMFQGESAVEDIVEQIKSTAIYQTGDSLMGKFLILPIDMLQQWVRGSCLNDGSGNDRYKLFCAAVVRPCLNINVASLPSNMEDILARFTAIIRGGLASEEDSLRLKLACSAIKGETTNHPLLCGLTLQCSRMLEKQARNIWTMAGRRSNCTEREMALISDAGQQLALACGNYNLAKEFGISPSACRISFDELKIQSLPSHPLALRWPDILRENFVLLDQRFRRSPETPTRL